MRGPSASNQITVGYYMALVGQINRGTCSKIVSKVLRQNGEYSYHLLSD